MNTIFSNHFVLHAAKLGSWFLASLHNLPLREKRRKLSWRPKRKAHIKRWYSTCIYGDLKKKKKKLALCFGGLPKQAVFSQTASPSHAILCPSPFLMLEEHCSLENYISIPSPCHHKSFRKVKLTRTGKKNVVRQNIINLSSYMTTWGPKTTDEYPCLCL